MGCITPFQWSLRDLDWGSEIFFPQFFGKPSSRNWAHRVRISFDPQNALNVRCFYKQSWSFSFLFWTTHRLLNIPEFIWPQSGFFLTPLVQQVFFSRRTLATPFFYKPDTPAESGLFIFKSGGIFGKSVFGSKKTPAPRSATINLFLRGVIVVLA